MLPLSSFLSILQQVSFVMTAPTFQSFVTVLTGWVFARRRVITRMIESADAVGSKHHSAFHRVFSTARWSRDELGLAVLALIERWVPGVVFLCLDDTLARKRGLKVFGVGMHHDPLISTRKVALVNWGHSWVVLSVVLCLPFRKNHYFSLPILFRLYISKSTAAKKRLPYRTRPQLAVEMLNLLGKHRENRRFHAIADSAYGGHSVLSELPANVDLTSRLGLDARLYNAPPVKARGTRGRPRRRGKRLPTPRQLLDSRRGHSIRLNLYGRRDRSRVVVQEARVHAVPERPLRIVAVEPLSGGRTAQAFYSTCQDATAEQVLTWYARRWSIEETFHDAKGHLGFEEPQGWTRKAVERTAPTAMLLYSLIVAWFAEDGHRHYQPPWRPWYTTKCGVCFVDMLNTLRAETIRQRISSLGLQGQGSRNVLKILLHVVKQAA